METEAFIELLSMLPPDHIERLMQVQNQVRSDTSEPRDMPEMNSQNTPPSNRPMGIYKGSIYA